MHYLSDWFIRTASLRLIGGFAQISNGWGTDDLTWFKISVNGGVGYTNSVLFNYRYSNANTTSTVNLKAKNKSTDTLVMEISRLIDLNPRKDANSSIISDMIIKTLDKYSFKQKSLTLAYYINKVYFIPFLLSKYTALFILFIKHRPVFFKNNRK